MRRDGSVALTAGQGYSLIALTATSRSRKRGATAPTVGNPCRKNKSFLLGDKGHSDTSFRS